MVLSPVRGNDMMYEFDHYILAETNELLTIDTRAENRLAVHRLATQTKRQLALISRELDPDLYNTTEFIETVRYIALKNKFAEIRIAVARPQLIICRGHRLVDLAGTLSSFIQLRKLPESFNNFGENILIADEAGYYHRENDARFDATVNFNDRRRSRTFMEMFNRVWQESKPDPNLRRIIL